MSTLIKKHLIRPFLNATPKTNPTWVQIKKATEYNLSLNPTTEERNYISDELPTTEVMGYKPSLPLSITTNSGEDDFELFYKLYLEKATGDEAKTQFMHAFLFDSVVVGDKTYYKAERYNCSITIDEFNASSSSISATVYFNGTPTQGYLEIGSNGTPNFTEGQMPTSTVDGALQDGTNAGQLLADDGANGTGLDGTDDNLDE